ncbi:hypothetical protein AMTRI_Chr10g226630 [Amborella trichopoda]|uniref:Uncharacterized protein n=1 Tax=Amborella trichopoda TaxID=13333 RepID=U5D5Z8_AMBTC|nr:cytochrome P450 85A1 [Amborella trichopoda]ERN17869.1 hypothetical protein AMTR_s00047p00210610 [Amborella trichopoda]|eukprot:XP_020530468.1 cytochrome P450 85A1 [Amborella trichopoda]
MVVLVVLSWLFFWVVMGCLSCVAMLKWNEVRYRKKGLPPGTMGWPLFGETSEFLTLGIDFLKNQKARYGSLFKTHILGCPTIVCMDPDLNKFIFLNEGKGFVAGYPQSMFDILGEWNIAAVHGPLHKAMRGVMFQLTNNNMIRDHLLLDIDHFMRTHHSNWANSVLDIQEMTKKMALLLALKQVLGMQPGQMTKVLEPEFHKLIEGIISLPINLPGTNYHKGFQGRQRILSFLRKFVEDRRAFKETHTDMLDALLRNEEDPSKFQISDDQIFDLLLAILYAGYETVSTTSMMAVKYLYDHPKALQKLREEHSAIRNAKGPDDPITWDDYKSMEFTHAVIYETMRLSTIVNGVFRKTTQDMELNGYLIPKGWKIYVYVREINYDPLLYPDPFTFNPWRWLEENTDSHRYFLLFGGGIRQCPGKELGKVEIAVFLHYFVTRYGWEEIDGNKILKFPRVEAPNGLIIRIWER